MQGRHKDNPPPQTISSLARNGVSSPNRKRRPLLLRVLSSGHASIPLCKRQIIVMTPQAGKPQSGRQAKYAELPKHLTPKHAMTTCFRLSNIRTRSHKKVQAQLHTIPNSQTIHTFFLARKLSAQHLPLLRMYPFNNVGKPNHLHPIPNPSNTQTSYPTP